MPNASEIARELTENRLDILRSLAQDYKYASKGYKEQLLRDLRRIERELDIPSIDYNSSEFMQEVRDACKALSVQSGQSLGTDAGRTDGLAPVTDRRYISVPSTRR